jgi:hypothetical protein
MSFNLSMNGSSVMSYKIRKMSQFMREALQERKYQGKEEVMPPV